MQKRYLNFNEDDSTFIFNQKDLVLIPYGRYSGFEADLDATMVLKLKHSLVSTQTKINLDLTETVGLGVWKSKQGVVVMEDDTIPLVIGTGDPTNSRIDLVVAEHEFIETTGGATATYKVIQGIPALIPVAPALQNSNQVILGRLEVRFGMTSLTNAVYTPESIPSMGNDANAVKTNVEQTFTANQTFNVIKNTIEIIDTYDDSGAELFNENPSNFYIINLTSVASTGYTRVAGLSKALQGTGQKVTFYTRNKLLIDANINTSLAYNISTDTPIYIEANSTFVVMDMSDTVNGGVDYRLIQGGEAVTHRSNKHHSIQIWNKEDGLAVIQTIAGIDYIQLPINMSNFVEVDGFNGTAAVKLINSLSKYKGLTNSITDESGGLLIMKFNGDLFLNHDATGANTESKPVWIPSEKDIIVNNGSVCTFLEDTDYWRLLSIVDTTRFATEYVGTPRLEELTGISGGLPNDDGEVLISSYVGTSLFHEFKNLVDEIRNSNIKMLKTFELKAHTYNTNATISILQSGSADYLNIVNTLGNCFIFKHANPFSVAGLRSDYQIGTKFRFHFQNSAKITLILDGMIQNSDASPFKLAGYTGTNIAFTNYDNVPLTLEKMDTYWLISMDNVTTNLGVTDDIDARYAVQ